MNLLHTFRSARLTVVLALVAFGLVAAPAGNVSAHQPSARIEMNIVSGGFIIGATGGSGTLYHGGRAHPLTIGGLSIGFTLGVKAADVVGEVYNLRRPSDINGAYTAIGAGATLGAGASVATLVNGRGVRLRLRMVQVGLGYSLALGGVVINMR